MSDFYWPTAPGSYQVRHRNGDTDEWSTSDGVSWNCGMSSPYSRAEMTEAGYLGVRREDEKPRPVVDPGYYWPDADDDGEYILEHQSGDTGEWKWDGRCWLCLAPGFHTILSTEELIASGHLGVRRANPIITPKPDNAATAQQALDEWRACKQQPKAANWAYKWAVTLCEIAGAS